MNRRKLLNLFRSLTLFEPSGDEIALDGQQRELPGLAKVRDRGGGPSEFGSKCATHGVIEMITLQHRALGNVVERVQPGLRAMKLRVERFDGKPPARRLRRWRVLCSLLSALSLGMGYAWRFLDEDGLCWH